MGSHGGPKLLGVKWQSLRLNPSASGVSALGRIGWSHSSYRRVDIQVSGERPYGVKTCISRIFLLYGRPDEVPAAHLGSKKAGKKIVDELLKESSGRPQNGPSQPITHA